MRGSDNRVPLLTAIFVALLLAVMPGTAEAGVAPLNFPATTGQTAQNCSGMTGVALCQCQATNAHAKRAQDLTVANLKVTQNVNILSMKWVYCWDNVILPALNSIAALTSSGNGANPLGGLIWAAIQSFLTSILNSVCQQVASAIRSVINYVKNLICIPIPHFNLSLGGLSFSGGSCSGMSLFNLLNMGVTQPVNPSGFQLWNYTPQ